MTLPFWNKKTLKFIRFCGVVFHGGNPPPMKSVQPLSMPYFMRATPQHDFGPRHDLIFVQNVEDVLSTMQGFVSRGAPDGRTADGGRTDGRELIASELKLLDRAYENKPLYAPTPL